MKNKKKIIVLALEVIILGSILVGCANDKPVKTELTKEKTVVTTEPEIGKSKEIEQGERINEIEKTKQAERAMESETNTETELKTQVKAETEVVEKGFDAAMNVKNLDLSDYEKQAVEVVRKSSTYDLSADSLCMTADYDHDGKEETFVLVSKGYDEEWNTFGEAELFYVEDDYSPKKLSDLDEDYLLDVLDTQYVYESEEDGNTYLLLRRYQGLVEKTAVLYIQGQEIVSKSLDYLGSYQCFFVDEQGRICIVQSAYDMLYEDDMWTGHTWKNYPGKMIDGEFISSVATEITADDLYNYANGKEIFDKVAGVEGLLGYQILNREERFIHINIAVKENDSVRFLNYTYSIDESNQLVLSSDYHEGTYLKAFPYDKEDDNNFCDKMIQAFQD